MILQSIIHLEERLRNTKSLPQERKAELQRQLSELHAAADGIPRHDDNDLPIAPAIDPDGPVEPIVNQLLAAIDSLPASNPRLTELANRFATTLAHPAAH